MSRVEIIAYVAIVAATLCGVAIGLAIGLWLS